MSKCQWPRCKSSPDMEYLNRPLCWKHWTELSKCTDYSKKEQEILKKLKLPPRVIE